jgi:lipoprotein-releasing system ATP-binding protein
MNEKPCLLKADNITKRFRSGESYLDVLKGVSLSINAGQLGVLTGPSGSGKSTLLYILGGLEKPDSGQILFDGESVESFSDERIDSYRNVNIGFVFQMHYLLPDFTAIENIIMPALIKGENRLDALKRAGELLSILALSERQNHYPNQLSGGEQQRVAVARAMINKPRLIFADEPTGNLDRENATMLLKLFRKLVEDTGVCIFVATHDQELAGMGEVAYHLHDGKIVGTEGFVKNER